MILAFDCIEIMLASLCLTMGIHFYVTKTGSRHIKFIILLMSISVFLVCAGYSLMSLWPDLNTAFIPRNFGVLGIDFYLVSVLLFVVLDLRFGKKAIIITHSLITILTVTDLIIFEHINANTYVKNGAYNIYVVNELSRHILHYVYAAIMTIIIVLFALMWIKNARYKREKRVFLYLIVANVGVLLGFVLDFLYSLVDPSNPTFVFCIFICVAFFVFYRACNQNNILTITTNNVQKDIFSTANVAVLAYNYKQELVLVSPYAKKLLDINEEDNPLPDDLFDISSRFRERLFETCTDSSAYDYKLRSKDGSKTFSITFQARLDSYNEPIVLILTLYDVTKEDELIAKATEASRAKTQFLAQMSHEIRTPINTILGMNEMIQRETKENNTAQYSHDIEAAGIQLLSIINDVLDMSKIESNKLEIIPTEYNLIDLINTITRLATPLAEKKGLDFVFTTDSSLPSRLYGDETRITQIFTNLISNAVKYTSTGSVSVSITGKAQTNDTITLLIEITDTGMGIKEEDIPKLYESFTRLNEGLTKHIEGTGLGIPIVNSLLSMMGSSLNVESKVHAGSKFFFELQQGIVDSTPIKDTNKKELERPSNSSKHVYAENAKVLIVDDNKMNLKVLQLLLKRNGIKPDMAMSGIEAIDFVANNDYHLIFMDHMMPEMDGIQTLHNLQLSHRLKHSTVVVALTANAIEGAREMYLNAGFHDYMAKPINVTELENCLSRYLPHDLIEYRDDTDTISFDDEDLDDFF